MPKWLYITLAIIGFVAVLIINSFIYDLFFLALGHSVFWLYAILTMAWAFSTGWFYGKYATKYYINTYHGVR